MTEIRIQGHIGPFAVLELLRNGRGGMARIFLAQYEREGRNMQRVALKIALVDKNAAKDSDDPSPAQDEVFTAVRQESDILRLTRHPNIVRIIPIPYDTPNSPFVARATELPGRPWYFAMEYLEGGSLKEQVSRDKVRNVEQIVEIAYQIGLALDHLHLKGIAHLDIKPDNIMFRCPLTNGQTLPEPVLIDFGIARRLQKTGLEAGAVSYMAPERIRLARGDVAPENAPTDQRPADVYGFGILLYYLLTGALPFRGRSKESITTAVLNDSPTRPTTINHNIPPALEMLILATLEKNPSDRPTISEILQRLDEICPPPRLAGGPEKLAVDPAPNRGNRRLKVLTGFTSFAAIAELAIVLAMSTGLVVTDPTPTPVATLAANHTFIPTPTVTSVSVVPTMTSPTALPTMRNTPTPVRQSTFAPTHTSAPTRSPAPLATETPVPVATQ